MQISDLTRQYNSTTASEAMTGTRGVEKLVSTVRELTVGNIFEGTVNSVSNGRVVLGLSNGSELAARLEANMQMVKGQSMFFQVKSNDGETIAIRPYTVDGTGVNLTLTNALKAANLPINAKNLNMVNSMMQEQMPINQNSLNQMARIMMANPDMSVNTLVQMKKLDIPITTEMVAQFENYMDDTNAVHKALDNFISELPSTMAGKDMPLEQLKVFDSQLLQIIADGMNESVPTTITEGGNVQAPASEVLQGASAEPNTVASETVNAVLDMAVTEEGAILETPEATVQTENTSMQSQTTGEKVSQLLNQLFGDTGITKEDSAASLLNKLSNLILNNQNVSKESLTELFSNKDMQQLLRDVLEEQMYLAPKDVADAEKVKKLFERLDRKTESLQNLLQSANLSETNLAQTVTNVHSNVEFMNQINQAYTFVQIPLKMSGQNASGQLYVYTNKKDINDPDHDLTAFLHLDMDHLGSTDVSVRMRNREVDTKFYLDNDEAFALIKAHSHELDERLKQKGFHCNIYVESEGKKVNFVEDFLKKDAPSTGQLHRYSFDMRA